MKKTDTIGCILVFGTMAALLYAAYYNLDSDIVSGRAVHLDVSNFQGTGIVEGKPVTFGMENCKINLSKRGFTLSCYQYPL